MKTMYKFYRVPDKEVMPILQKKKENGEISVADMYPLYAITYKKKFAREFRKTRDMSMFHELVDEDISDEEYALFVNKHRSCELQWHKYNTVIVDKKGIFKSCYFPVMTTYSEYNMVIDACDAGIMDDNLIDPSDWIDVSQYKNKYIKALSFIHYKECADLFQRYMHPSEDDTYEAPKMDWDELAVLLNNFSQLFK